MRQENGLNIFVRQINHDDDYGESYSAFLQIEAKYYHDLGYTPEEIALEIREHFHYSCGCEHDCCAHWQTYIVRVKQIGKWTYKGLLNGILNV